jgi:hypothetical protein
MFDEGVDSAFITEVVGLPCSSVANQDPHTGVQKRKLAKPLGEHIEGEFRYGKDFGIRLECDGGSRFFCLAADLQIRHRRATLKRLFVNFAGPFDFDAKLGRQSVHDRNTNAVETTRDFVGVFVEFSARVERCEYDFTRRAILGRMHVRWNATAVVDNRDAPGVFDGHEDFAAVSGECFVDRVVHDLVYEMMKPIGTRCPDIHRRSFSNRLEAL